MQKGTDDLQEVWQAYRQFPGLRQKIAVILSLHH
jgi:hypothetical protein